jgi:hypothetical protein
VNSLSRSVMERAGLTFLRSFAQEWENQIDGAEGGEVEYQLTREEYERTHL